MQTFINFQAFENWTIKLISGPINNFKVWLNVGKTNGNK